MYCYYRFFYTVILIHKRNVFVPKRYKYVAGIFIERAHIGKFTKTFTPILRDTIKHSKLLYALLIFLKELYILGVAGLVWCIFLFQNSKPIWVPVCGISYLILSIRPLVLQMFSYAFYNKHPRIDDAIILPNRSTRARLRWLMWSLFYCCISIGLLLITIILGIQLSTMRFIITKWVGILPCGGIFLMWYQYGQRHYKLPKNGQGYSVTQVCHEERWYDVLEIQGDFVRTRQYDLFVNWCCDGLFDRIFAVPIVPFQQWNRSLRLLICHKLSKALCLHF